METKKDLLREVMETEASMQDLLTDIYAVNMAMYMECNMPDMPDEFKELGKQFLIDRNMSFMRQHMHEVWLDYHKTVKKIREQGAHLVPIEETA